ncbi:MAG: hypothetical protein AAGJ35_15585 [Myxococcota bacterium]
MERQVSQQVARVFFEVCFASLLNYSISALLSPGSRKRALACFPKWSAFVVSTDLFRVRRLQQQQQQQQEVNVNPEFYTKQVCNNNKTL